MIVHAVEPYYHWRNLYISSEDELSPFYQQEYSEFYFENKIYNYLIHPQWDNIGSKTLFIKILFTDYDQGYSIIELIGEWNDTIENDIMTLKRNIIEELQANQIDKFILIGENVLNFHSSDDCYYEEWFDEIEEGWIAMINFHEHVEQEFSSAGIDHYLNLGNQFNDIDWNKFLPHQFFDKVNSIIQKRLY